MAYMTEGSDGLYVTYLHTVQYYVCIPIYRDHRHIIYDDDHDIYVYIRR